MAYSNEELEQRIKQLEDILLSMQSAAIASGRMIPGICTNQSLHGQQDFSLLHPPNLEVPHYIWQPAIDWERNLINLHPLNAARCKECRRLPGMPTTPCPVCQDHA